MRRFVDCFLSFAFLVVLSPLLVFIACVIVTVSPGSPFYLAPRAGKDGKPFRMWKFRTMVPRASTIGPPITGAGDSRIIRFGDFLRRTKLDELPQFINVFVGDMSLVGPRPETPEIVALYRPSQRQVLSVKPGMTGKVQLESREESDSIPASEKADEYYIRHLMERKLDSDLEYLQRRTARSDTWILFSTALYVLRAVVRL